MAIELSTASDATLSAIRDALQSPFEERSNGAIVAGDLTGNARGNNSIDIQSFRYVPTQVASGNKSSAFGYANSASGYYSSAVGAYNTASNYRSLAFGFNNSASGYYSSAVGIRNTASGERASAFGYGNTASFNNGSAVGYNNSASSGSSAFGYNNSASGNYSLAVGTYNTASGRFSSAFGNQNTASGYKSSAFGSNAKTTVDNTQEFGYWSNAATRGGAVRVHATKMVAITLQNRATAYDDGGATAGSEADNTLMREGYAIRRNGDDILIDINVAGTVKTLSLGTAA